VKPLQPSVAAPILTAGIAALLIAALGATVTDLGPWYRGLRQPDWAPPDALYGIAWTAIYACTALAAVAAWRATPDRRRRDWIIGLFALNGFLNILWSLIFFRVQRPDWALIEVVFLWLSIVALMLAVRRHSRGAVWLLLPYLLWVSFAGALNAAIVSLNAPFV
jgi:benzodiazapine receptor